MMRFADEQLFATIKTKMNVECACAQGRMLVQDSHHARNRINEFFFFFFVLSILIFARGFVFFLSLEKQCPIKRHVSAFTIFYRLRQICGRLDQDIEKGQVGFCHEKVYCLAYGYLKKIKRQIKRGSPLRQINIYCYYR